MTRADNIRAAIAKHGPLTIDGITAILEEPRRKVSATIWAMEADELLARNAAGQFSVARAPLTRTEVQAIGTATKRARRVPKAKRPMRTYARPVVPPDPLWVAFTDARLPAFNPAPLRWAA